MSNGKVYDPLIGQWMTPLWENVLERVSTPTHLHLYRFNGNDPINLHRTYKPPQDHLDWLNRLGYNLRNLAPQLYPETLPPITNLLTTIRSGFLAQLENHQMTSATRLSSPPKSGLKLNVMDLNPKKIGAASDPPFGRGILVSKNQNQAIVSSTPAANAIYRDVYTSVFNRSQMLPFTFVVHSAQQDAFYFVKEEAWRAVEDRGQLKRLQGQVNTTFHDNKDNGSLDVKIHASTFVINLRYGTSLEKENQRLLHHAKLTAIRKAWHRERDAIRSDLPPALDWSPTELEEIRKLGYASNYEGEYIHEVRLYPELAEDPYNIKFVKKQTEQPKTRKRRGVSECLSKWWFPWSDAC